MHKHDLLAPPGGVGICRQMDDRVTAMHGLDGFTELIQVCFVKITGPHGGGSNIDVAHGVAGTLQFGDSGAAGFAGATRDGDGLHRTSFTRQFPPIKYMPIGGYCHGSGKAVTVRPHHQCQCTSFASSHLIFSKNIIIINEVG